jgi:hypothetical protein
MRSVKVCQRKKESERNGIGEKWNRRKMESEKNRIGEKWNRRKTNLKSQIAGREHADDQYCMYEDVEQDAHLGGQVDDD